MMESFTHYTPPVTKIPSLSNKRFHVFLSFCGKDVRKTLVDHLHESLSAAGVHVFLDSHRLKKGEIIDLSLEQAIKSSGICIPIFSKGYASSTWCLREATLMHSSPGLLIPLFYDVEPTQVRYPQNDSSPYAEAFKKHYSHLDRHKTEEIERWKQALHQICSRSGWSMETTSGFEGQLVRKVTSDVINTLDSVPLDVAKYPMGLVKATDAVIRDLNLNSVDSVIRVGILGIDGIGKTTVAKAVYNEVYRRFEKSSFLFNVRSTAEKITGLVELQKTILKDLAEFSGEVRSVDHGKSLMRDRLGRLRALVIVDDVDDWVQLEALAGDWLGPGSRIIIVSRDRHILHIARVSSELVHELNGLKRKEALQLFIWHVFQRASPDKGYEDVLETVVEACHGHPHSLEVIGTFLSDKKNYSDKECWKETANNIAGNEAIFRKFNISYSALSPEEKEIFLDIACFFIGENMRYPIVLWRSLYCNVSTAINNLSMKLLIKINDKGAFDMHGHVQGMGRKIAEKENKRIRLWEAADIRSLCDSIKSHGKNISGLSVAFAHRGYNPEKIKLSDAPDLRYLHLKATTIEDDIGKLAPNLIWLRLDHCWFSAKMEGLNMYKSFSYWKRKQSFRFFGNNTQLRIMQLGHCIDLQSLPNTVGKLSHLQSLDLSNCWGLRRLPKAIGDLSQLQSLNLSHCYSLSRLPKTIGNLSQLQYLYLRRCNKLQDLPRTLGNMSQLQFLDLSWCENLNNIGEGFDKLTNLETLHISGCYGSKSAKLPKAISSLSQLKNLDMSQCKDFEVLPDSFENLSQLQSFDLSRCSLLNAAETIGNLSQLQDLDLSQCARLENLPESFGNLSQLRSLKLCGCGLKNVADAIGNLSQLQYLDMSMCKFLKRLPDTIGNLGQLHNLNLSRCYLLERLPDTVGNLSRLQRLNLSRCHFLQKLPSTIGNLLQLKSLKLAGCSSLESLPDNVRNLTQLESLDLRTCYGFQSLPDTMETLSELRCFNRIWPDGSKPSEPTSSATTPSEPPSSATTPSELPSIGSGHNPSQPSTAANCSPVMTSWTWKDAGIFQTSFLLKKALNSNGTSR